MSRLELGSFRSLLTDLLRHIHGKKEGTALFETLHHLFQWGP